MCEVTKDFIKTSLIVVGIIIGFIGIALWADNVTREHDLKKWNNGKCSYCGGNYELISVTKANANSNPIYYYECDKCGAVIELSHSMKKER